MGWEQFFINEDNPNHDPSNGEFSSGGGGGGGDFKTHEEELTKYYHTARIATDNPSRNDRLNYAAKEFHKAHPEVSHLKAYKMVDSATRP